MLISNILPKFIIGTFFEYLTSKKLSSLHGYDFNILKSYSIQKPLWESA